MTTGKIIVTDDGYRKVSIKLDFGEKFDEDSAAHETITRIMNLFIENQDRMKFYEDEDM
jgi:hypothetical protein